MQIQKVYFVRKTERGNFNRYLKHYFDDHYDYFIDLAISILQEYIIVDIEEAIELVVIALHFKSKEINLYDFLKEVKYPHIEDEKKYGEKRKTLARAIVGEAWPKYYNIILKH